MDTLSRARVRGVTCKAMDWRSLDLFEGIDLNDSFVLDWHHNDDQLIFEVEASITSLHNSLYEKTEK